MPEAEEQPAGPVTLTQIVAEVRGLRAEVNARLDGIEGTVNQHTELLHNIGLNGQTPLLKAFLEQYSATYQERQAWQTLVGAWGYRLRFLTAPRNWLKAIFYAFLGGLGFTLVDRALHISLPFDLFHLGG